MFRKLKLFGMSCLVVASASAFSAGKETGSVEARAIMDGVYDSFVKVMPYVYNDDQKSFGDKKSKDELLKNLTDISEYFKSAKHVEYFQRPGFRPSLDTINQHLQDTLNSVRADNFHFTKKRLNALTQLCISCHAQLSDSTNPNSFGSMIHKANRSSFESDFAYANYLYLIRNFKESQTYFTKALDEAVVKGKEEQLNESLRKVFAMNTMIDFNFKAANALILKYEKEKEVSPLVTNLLKSWKTSLVAWKDFNPKKIKSIDSFIQTHLVGLEPDKTSAGQNDVTLLVASGVLSKYLVENPKTDETPKILYWLAVAEKRLSRTYFFSLGDLYLKECIQLYPKSDYAKQCYNEYAENLEFGFSGSSGTDIPREEREELSRLKRLLQ